MNRRRSPFARLVAWLVPAALATNLGCSGGSHIDATSDGTDASTDAVDDAANDGTSADGDPDATSTTIVPEIDGTWWTVASNPDLGALTGPAQQPVDFGLWPAGDGTWQLWSCIRGTREVGQTRLFHRWEGASLTATNWRPLGVAMRADPATGETPGGLQAPFVIRNGTGYRMFYGSWWSICAADSTDGKTFTRRLDAGGQCTLFTEGAASNSRDPMVLRIGDEFVAYYTAWDGRRAGVYARRSRDLSTWGPSVIVSIGGVAGDGGVSAECPFVVRREDTGYYYLFRTQRYGLDAQTTIYRSPDPFDFGRDDDRYRIGTLPVAAPEIVEVSGQTYMAALRPALDGIQIARLRWASRP